MNELESNQNWCDAVGASSKLEGEKQRKTWVQQKCSLLYHANFWLWERPLLSFQVLDRQIIRNWINKTKEFIWKLDITEIKLTIKSLIALF